MTAHELEDRLTARLGKVVHVTFTKNRVRMVSFREQQGVVQLRVQELFGNADRETIHALADWIKAPNGGPPERIRRFIARNHTETNPQQSQGYLLEGVLSSENKRKVRLRSEGKVHDLQGLLNTLNKTYFNGKLALDITWGRNSRKKMVRTRRLGSYQHHANLIVIHPLLDNNLVPQYFIEFIIYHEMLHSQQPVDHKRPHDKAFRQREREFARYEQAIFWQKNNTAFLHGIQNKY